MRKTIFLALAALALTAGGCSSSEDDEAPVREGTIVNDSTKNKGNSGIAAGNDERPNWQIPDFSLYASEMNVVVELQKSLEPYATTRDLMAAIINGEVRGVAEPQLFNGHWLFELSIGSNNNGDDMQLSYYCDSLHRIFNIQWATFDPNAAPSGTGSLYQPVFVK